MSTKYCTTLLAVFSLFLICRASVEDELHSMTSAQLAKLERELKEQVEQHNKQLQDMRKDTENLKQQQKVVDQEAERLQGAKKWELEEKAKREKELENAKEDVYMKQESIQKMTVQVSDLKDQIENLENKLQQLNRDKESTEKRFHDPSLLDVLDSRSQNWGNVTRNVYNKTMTDVVPVLDEMRITAQSMRRRVSQTSRFFELLASLVIYGFFIASAMIIFRVYRKLRGRLTIPRLLFIGDAFCAAFWTILLLCFAVLLDDPLYVLKQRSPTPFFIFQLVACFSYVNFVLLRVLVLASKMTLGALGETLAVVVVGHHYYVRVWQPAILDKPFHGTMFYYFCYAWLFSAFAYNRIQEFAPLKQLRGPRLPPLMWLRVVFARFTARGVPDGDIESRVHDDSDDGHEH